MSIDESYTLNITATAPVTITAKTIWGALHALTTLSQTAIDDDHGSMLSWVKDIQALVRHGRERGVRVIPEIDLPGHSASGWLQVDKKAVTCAESWWDNDGRIHHTAVEPNSGQLDISYEGTYNLIKDVHSEWPTSSRTSSMSARMNSRPIASTTLPWI
ncbi:hypothetical protein BGX34_004160, partial [Mortierella sp. NVP85]